MKLSGAQVAAARELLKITQAELAAASGLGLQTIFGFESGKHEPYPSTVAKIRAELERRGIEFTNGDSPPSSGAGMGVRINFEKAAVFARLPPVERNEADR